MLGLTDSGPHRPLWSPDEQSAHSPTKNKEQKKTRSSVARAGGGVEKHSSTNQIFLLPLCLPTDFCPEESCFDFEDSSGWTVPNRSTFGISSHCLVLTGRRTESMCPSELRARDTISEAAIRFWPKDSWFSECDGHRLWHNQSLYPLLPRIYWVFFMLTFSLVPDVVESPKLICINSG